MNSLSRIGATCISILRDVGTWPVALFLLPLFFQVVLDENAVPLRDPPAMKTINENHKQVTDCKQYQSKERKNTEGKLGALISQVKGHAERTKPQSAYRNDEKPTTKPKKIHLQEMSPCHSLGSLLGVRTFSPYGYQLDVDLDVINVTLCHEVQ
jgi:hypothetical protein